MESNHAERAYETRDITRQSTLLVVQVAGADLRLEFLLNDVPRIRLRARSQFQSLSSTGQTPRISLRIHLLSAISTREMTKIGKQYCQPANLSSSLT